MLVKSFLFGIFSALFFATALTAELIDLNADGLPDIWQQRYNAQSLLPNDDSDGDSYLNIQEAEAGTDPFDAQDFPQFDAIEVDGASETFSLTFPTKSGKRYQLGESTILGGFNPLGPIVIGDGLPYIVSVSPDAATRSGNVLVEQWANIGGNAITALTNQPTFPFKPNGLSRLESLEVTTVLASGFGGRLVTLVTPPQSGSYSFFLSAGSSAELLLSSDSDPDNLQKIAEILPAQDDIEPNGWSTYESQRSVPMLLNSGQSYLLQVNYLASSAASHCQVGWTGPGITGIEVISEEYLARQGFALPVQVVSELFSYDYDSANQTDALWSDSEIVAAPVGMNGNAERIMTDSTQSTSGSTPFAVATEDHFYASFLVQIGDGNQNVSLFFQGGSNSQEGPRVEFDLRAGLPSIRAGGTAGNAVFTNVEYDRVYRVELVASLDTDFRYGFDQSLRTVEADTFDVYISDPQTCELFGQHQGLAFRDGVDVVQQIEQMRLSGSSSSSIFFDEFKFTAGSISGEGILKSNLSTVPDGFTEKRFFCLTVDDQDQDADGLSDWEEIILGEHSPYLFFDSQTESGVDDASGLATQLSDFSGEIEVSLQASDTLAYEDFSPNIGEDHGEILITRTGEISPVRVKLCVTPLMTTGSTATICDGSCCSLIGTAGDEEAELEDYQIIDEDGTVITDEVFFELGEMTKTLTVKALKDAINEYPETLNLALATPAVDADYTVSAINGASIQLFDLPDSPSNNAIFTGLFSRDGNAVTATSGSGSTTAILNGPRTKLYLTTEFAGLTSAQQDAHIHKSNVGSTASDRVGTIIYEVTNTPGDSTSGILLGSLQDYLWDISDSAGAVSTTGGGASKQVIIDSLFGQNQESPLYFNVHTVDNPAGEIWSFLGLTGGSITDPGEPAAAAVAGSAEYPLLTGEELEADVRRFLDQATFGGTEADVEALITAIENERLTDPTYHRSTALSAWIDQQMAVPQTYLLDYNLALDFQQLKLADWFDPILNAAQNGFTTPSLPTTWPTVDRTTNPDPARLHITEPYPVNKNDEDLAGLNGLSRTPGNSNRRQAHWQMMVNAPDQLRQKMGFALQQIVVVSTASSVINRAPHGSSHYQDMLNTYAFSYYRDVLGFVNWNPLMGRWLSSLQNQKGLDLDNDGQNDTSPDENLARENMQLFSIGLFELWADGTLKLGTDGAPNNTYTNEDIREFAKVITGQSFSVQDSRREGWGGIPYDFIEENTNFSHSQSNSDIFGAKYLYPMIMFGEYHDRSVKTFAGTTIDNTHLTDPKEQGIADMEDALDWLAGKPNDGEPDFTMVNSHVSTPAFICRRLIQRLVKSNPSREYLHRVAETFKNSEGNLALTLKAILLDPEARVLDLTDPSAGMKKSPLEAFIHVLRQLDAFTYVPVQPTNGVYPFDAAPGTFSNPELYLSHFGYPVSQADGHRLNQRVLMPATSFGNTIGLQMEPFRQETVFNWYLPDFAPSGPLASLGLVAPEMMLANEQDVIRNINYFREIYHDDRGVSGSAIGNSNALQLKAYSGDASTTIHDNVRVDHTKLADELYPTTPPVPTGGETVEYLANLELLDRLDRRLTHGNLKKLYPIDPSDDGVDGVDQNPRELILSSITYGGDNPYDGNNDLANRVVRIQQALYLIVASPDFQIRY